MNRKETRSIWATLSVFIILLFAGSALGQINSYDSFAEDTAINPHDFTDKYYASNGVYAPAIFGRRNGSDALSIFSYSSNPIHTNVRVVATIPGYNENGEIVFWYPLGEIQSTGFTRDKIGVQARDLASHFPIYVFPDTSVIDFRTFANTRQAALLDNSWSQGRSLHESTRAPRDLCRELHGKGIRERWVRNDGVFCQEERNVDE
jgi:hypothetical protein